MALSEIQVRSAKPTTKARKLFDTGGLYLHVMPTGGRWWRFKFRFGGKERLLSLGVYPDVGLKDAREKRDGLRKQLAAGIDPGSHRKAIKTSRVDAQANSFEVIAREWHQKRAPQWVPITATKKLTRLEQDVFPWIGKRPIHELKAPELLAVLRRVEARAAHELARRVRQMMGQIFRYAIATGRADRDPAADLRDALPPAKETHHAAITEPKAVGALMRAIDGFAGEAVTRAALRLAPRLFVRPGELRAAEWSEFDLDAALWRIPAARMKMRDAHLVPLSRQGVATLRDLYQLTGSGRYVFPGARSKARYMSENTINAALRRLGYSKSEMTGHGFRTTASTLLNEQGWDRDAIVSDQPTAIFFGAIEACI